MMDLILRNLSSTQETPVSRKKEGTFFLQIPSTKGINSLHTKMTTGVEHPVLRERKV